MPLRSLLVRSSISAALLAVAAAGLAPACTTQPTEIVAGMTTQIQVPKELAAVGVVIRYGGQLVSCRSYPLSDGTVTLPSTLGVVPQEGREGEVLEPVTVTVLGFRTAEQGLNFDDTCVAEIPGADDPEVLVVRSKRMPYIDDRIVYLPMPLRESCAKVVCGDEETCVGGVCESLEVDPETAVDYKDSLVFGNTNTCFDLDICMVPAITQPVILEDPDTCTFRYPVAPDTDPPDVPDGALNVRIVYQSFGTEILDLDESEGFVFPDPTDPLTFRLAANLCESNYKTGKILGVFAAPGCPAKPALQPICEDDLEDIMNGEGSPQSPTDEAICNVGDSLTPSESALYVLLDRSSSMSDLFNPTELPLAIDIPLRNPVSARTQLGFSFLPAASSDCTDSSYVAPELGFDDPELVRGLISDALIDPTTVLSDDPMLFVDAAMTGAYEALADLQPVDSTRFNRRAVVIVGNRDYQSHCDPTLGAADALAAAALADDGIYTYVAVLEAPDSAEQFGDDPQTSGAAIATAGGTSVFDDIADEGEGPLAVQKVLNDLGSCLYDPPNEFTKVAATYLSYVNPTTLERSDIERNPECDSEAAAETVDGWGLDADGAVRICGAPCAELRETLTDVATFYAVLGESAPRVPIVPSVLCDDPFRFELPE